MINVYGINTSEKEIYPCLKESKDEFGHLIILFNEKESGIVVYSKGSIHKIGDYSECWDENGFVLCDQSVKIGNS